jgi:asparagine synthetase A
MSMEPTGKRDSVAYSKKMNEAKDELSVLQDELNNVMVKFVLRALRIYQSTRPEPLRPSEITLLVNNELKNALLDLQAQPNVDALAKTAKEAWAKEQKK